MTTAVIVQARMASTRLPGKVMEKLGEWTVLEHVLTRCAMIPDADMVICAVPDAASSEPLERVVRTCGARLFRGSETDVLARYLGAAQANRANTVMRVTSDCPLIDPDICGAVLRLREREAADYAANNMPSSFPHGLDCEAFTVEALAESAAATAEPYDREHVTPWLRRAAHLKRCNLASHDSTLAEHRWTLDYPEDLAFFRAIFERLPFAHSARMRDLLDTIDRYPELVALNRHRADHKRVLFPPEPDAIVVLAGGIKRIAERRWVSTDLTEEDDRQGAPGAKLRIYAATILAERFPGAIIVASGGKGNDVPPDADRKRPLLAEVLRDELVASGVAAARIILEDKANTTYQQLMELQQASRKQGWKRLVIVTNRWHLARVEAMLQLRFTSLMEHVDVKLVSAEEVLIETQPGRWQALLAEAYDKDFLKNRMEREARGVEQIYSGTYCFA